MSDIGDEDEISKYPSENKWVNAGLRILTSTASHPFEYAKILIQIGYEPIPPHPSKNLLGRPVLRLPTIFEYVKHIKSVDGFIGLYKGLTPKLCGNLLSTIISEKCAQLFEKQQQIESDIEENIEIEDDDSEIIEVHSRELPESSTMIWIKSMRKDIIIRTTAIIVTQPLHVITIRMMAEFVGKEAKHVGIFSSIKEIYHQNGISGFFSGIIPRVLGDTLTILLAGTLTYVINRYIAEEKEFKNYIGASMNFVASAVMYPFQVVANTMAVTNSGLVIGSPNYMPHYHSWIECWSDLSRQHQLKRGASLIFRYYTRPQIIVGGKLLPVARDPIRSLS